ncbi:MAG: WD40 repeat domain-containing protein [Phycisphaera sp. RhM]|nr:WD40 repeat domain-containing protein [Phycisphaera sp. RhM]
MRHCVSHRFRRCKFHARRLDPEMTGWTSIPLPSIRHVFPARSSAGRCRAERYKKCRLASCGGITMLDARDRPRIMALCLLVVSLGILNRDDSGAMEPTVLLGHTDAVYDVAFSPDGTLLASGSYDNTVKVWRVADAELVATLKGHTEQVFRLAFSADGTSLASCGGDSQTFVWEVGGWAKQQTLTGHGDPMIDVTFSEDGTTLVTAGSHIQLWRDETEVWATPHSDLYFTVAFSPNQKQLACGTRNLIHFYDASDGRLVRELVAGEGMIYQLAYSPDGRWLASACSNGNVTLWDAVQYTKIKTVTADRYSLFALSFSGDGQQILTGGRERVIRTWAMPGLQPIDQRYGPQETILSVNPSPDGKHLACGSYDGAIHVWSTED